MNIEDKVSKIAVTGTPGPSKQDQIAHVLRQVEKQMTPEPELSTHITVERDVLNLWHAAGNDPTRYHLSSIYVRVSGKELQFAATSGHIAARYECQTQFASIAGDWEIPVSVAKFALVVAKKKKKLTIDLDLDLGQVRVDGCNCGDLMPVTSNSSFYYGKIAALFEGVTKTEKGMKSVRFNPDLLSSLKKAFSRGKRTGLELSFRGENCPIIVEPREQDTGYTGLLMGLH